MHITTQTSGTLQLNSIVKPNADLVELHIATALLTHSARTTALCLLYTDWLMSGAGKYTRETFVRAFSLLGAELTVSSSGGRITLSLSCPEEHLSQALKLIELVIKKPTFSKTEFARAKKTLTNVLTRELDSAAAIAHISLTETLYQEDSQHHLTHPRIALSQLATIKPAEVLKLHTHIWSLPRTITVGGSAEAVATTEKFIKTLPKSTVTVTPPRIIATAKPKRLVTTDIASKQNIEVAIGSTLPFALFDAEAPAFIFGLAVLGKWGGFAGRLMSTVREKEGLTYNIYARTEGQSKVSPGYWRIRTFFAPNDVAKGITSTLREITLICTQGITDTEYKNFIEILRSEETLRQDSLVSTTNLVHAVRLLGFTWEEYQSFRSTLTSVSKESVETALKTFLDPNTLTISAAGPMTTAKKALAQFAKK